MKEKKFSKKFFHEIPGGTSRNIHGIFLDLELQELSVGTFYSGGTIFSTFWLLAHSLSGPKMAVAGPAKLAFPNTTLYAHGRWVDA